MKLATAEARALDFLERGGSVFVFTFATAYGLRHLGPKAAAAEAGFSVVMSLVTTTIVQLSGAHFKNRYADAAVRLVLTALQAGGGFVAASSATSFVGFGWPALWRTVTDATALAASKIFAGLADNGTLGASLVVAKASARPNRAKRRRTPAKKRTAPLGSAGAVPRPPVVGGGGVAVSSTPTHGQGGGGVASPTLGTPITPAEQNASPHLLPPQ